MFRKCLIVLLLGAIASSFLLTSEAQARRQIRRRVGISLSQQPQYPKSMRTRGLKQLGAVPALGGVRSLRFWGGER
jgi:hypothetical protein